MTALLLLRSGRNIVGRCDAACYDAREQACTCVCEGANHRVGYDRAVANTRQMADTWEQTRARGQPVPARQWAVEVTNGQLF